MYPEEGRSAILAAARAITDLRIGRIDDESSLRAALEMLVQRFDLEHFVITLAEGGLASLSGGRVHHFPALARAVLDVTGAGDTVVASLAPAGWLALSVETPGAEVLVDGVAVADPRAPIEVAPTEIEAEIRKELGAKP